MSKKQGFLKKVGITAFIAVVAFSLMGGFPAILKSDAEAAGKPFEGKTIRIMTWTDESGLAAVKHIAKPFQANTGANVLPDMTAATSEMVAKLKASAAKPQYDVVMLSGVGAFELANAGLLEKPDPSKIPNHSQVPQNLRFGAQGFGVGYYLWVDAMLYNTKTFPKAPTSFGVLWDKKYAGKVLIPPPQWTEAQQLVILAAEMAGGDIHNPEPGFKKLAELKPQVMLLGENIAQVVDLFRTNSLVVGGPYSPSNCLKFFPNAQYNLSATMNLKEGFFCDLQFMIIPKGHPGDTDVIHAFINYALDPKVQGLMAEEVAYGPINEKTVLSEKARKSGYIPTPELVKSKGRFIDNEFLAKIRPEWIKRYTEIFGF